MTIFEVISQKRKTAKTVCETQVSNCISNGKFTTRIICNSVEDRKLYVECMREVNLEMKGSGYHLDIVINDEKDIYFDIFVIRDEVQSQGLLNK